MLLYLCTPLLCCLCGLFRRFKTYWLQEQVVLLTGNLACLFIGMFSKVVFLIAGKFFF